MWNKIKNWLGFGVPEYDPDDFMTVWGVTDGPMTDDEGESWFVVAKVSIGEEVFFTNIYSETFPEAYEFAKHFKTNFEPLKIPLGEVEYEI
jgi:hypothetical protein